MHPPALLLGSGITVLGTLRSLARRGVQCYVYNPHRDLEAYSRHFVALPINEPAKDLISVLQNSTLKRAVLFACSDEWSLQVAALPESLGDRFVSCQSTASVQRAMVDKDQFRALLEQHSIPHPRTVSVDASTQLDHQIASEIDRFFIKPRNSQPFFREFQCKGFDLDSLDTFKHRFAACADKGLAVVLQEFIPGPATNHVYVEGIVLRDGSFPVTCARRRLRIFPERYGNSTAMLSIEPETVSQAVADLQRLLRAVRYRGIFSAEFKLDERTQVWKLLEINARPWWYVGFVAACGIDLPYYAYCDALGLPLPARPIYRTGVRGINGYTDLQVMKQSWRKGDLTLAQWFREWFAAECTVWSWRDPLPAASWLAGMVSQRLKRFVGFGTRHVRR